MRYYYCRNKIRLDAVIKSDIKIFFLIEIQYQSYNIKERLINLFISHFAFDFENYSLILGECDLFGCND